MASGVSFSLDDGSTITCPDFSLMVFVDETGHEELSDKDFPFFGYGGCLTFAVDYSNAIVNPWKAVERAFPFDMLPLHASSLKPARLTNAHFEALNGFFSENVFGRFAAICSDKTSWVGTQEETIFYMIVAVNKRIHEIMQTILNHGLIVSEIFMFIEHSKRTADKIAEYFSRCNFKFGSQPVVVHRYFMTKALNEPGLVVADFIAHTASTTVRSTHRGKVPKYLERLDFQSVFYPNDDRWSSFLEVNEVKYDELQSSYGE